MNEKKENVIVNGFFWRFAERCGVQLISAVVSILLARILTPDDYGKVALVTVFNNIMYVLLDCGIGTALVQKKEVDELDYSSAFFFSIVISFVLYGMISAIGVRNVVENRVDFTNSRNLIVAAVILVCALGFNSVGGVSFAVAGVTINLSGLAIAAIAGILLNAILPGNDYEFDAADGSEAASSSNLQV